MQEIAEKDKNVKIHRNEGPTRLGHTILKRFEQNYTEEKWKENWRNINGK